MSSVSPKSTGIVHVGSAPWTRTICRSVRTRRADACALRWLSRESRRFRSWRLGLAGARHSGRSSRAGAERSCCDTRMPWPASAPYRWSGSPSPTLKRQCGSEPSPAQAEVETPRGWAWSDSRSRRDTRGDLSEVVCVAPERAGQLAEVARLVDPSCDMAHGRRDEQQTLRCALGRNTSVLHPSPPDPPGQLRCRLSSEAFMSGRRTAMRRIMEGVPYVLG